MMAGIGGERTFELIEARESREARAVQDMFRRG